MQEAESEDAQYGCSREMNAQRRTTKPHSSSSHHRDSAPPKQHPLICTGAEPIHLVHGRLRLPATEAIPRNGVYTSACKFWCVMSI